MQTQQEVLSVNNLNTLVEKRKDWVRVSQENEFDFDSLLAGLYSNPSHFIYELLQNAEDAGASRVEFSLNQDRLVFRHNGRPFNLKDVEAITGIGNSTKRDDINAIGKFGVGFKSVFAISQSPIIKSDNFHFTISDFVVPEFLEGNATHDETQIILPFNHSTRNPDEVFRLIYDKLDNIDLKTLLFLTNIHEIAWKTSDHGGEYIKTTSTIPESQMVSRVQLISQKGGTDTYAEYLVFQKTIRIGKKSNHLQIAFLISQNSEGKECLLPEKDTRLCVFFPTERVTFLDFLIQAPFKTNPSREDIPLEDPENANLISEITDLYEEAFPIIKQLGLLTVGFLEILPLTSKYCTDSIYGSFYSRTIKLLGSEQGFLPLYPNGFGSANEVLLAGVKDIADFLSSYDINLLYGKQHWLSTEITLDLTRDLRDYLVHTLKISEVEYPDFVRRITSDFMAGKSDEWVTELYSKIHERPALWRAPGQMSMSPGIARQKPIIRLEDDSHIEPFDSKGNAQVYLPSDASTKYKTVKRTIGETENGRQFLKIDLQLSEPDTLAEIRQFIIPKYRAGNIEFILIP